MSLLNRNSNSTESARTNGAKSRGPVTEDGLYRSRTANFKHGLYAVRSYKLPGESNEEYAEFQAHLTEYWQPAGFMESQLVESLVGNLWEAKRLQAAKNDHVHDKVANIISNSPGLKDQAKINLLAEQDASVASGTLDRLNARLQHLSRERQRLQNELLKLKKHAHTSGSTQMSLEINNRQHPGIPATEDAKPVPGDISECPYVVETGAEPVPDTLNNQPKAEPETAETAEQPSLVEWADEALGFQPDAFQTQILTESNSRIMILGPRQSGKSTAVAVRVLFEAMAHDYALILLASASSRQSGQIMEKARKMAQTLDCRLLPPPSKCDGFTLENGSQIVSLPDSQETIRGFSAPRLIVVDEAAFASPEVFKALEPMMSVSGGTIILLSTPNGQTGYFYEQWHAEPSHWARIQGTLEACPRMKPEAIEAIRKSMSKEDFQQEFECKFIAPGGQFISRETFRKCLRDDLELFLPGLEQEY